MKSLKSFIPFLFMQTWIIVLVAVAAFTASAASAGVPQAVKTPAERVAQLLADQTLLQGDRDTLELAQNLSRSCHFNVQQLISNLLTKLASVKYELGNELKYPFPTKHLACLSKPWTNELFPDLGRVNYILEEVAKALCAQNYAVKCDVNDVKPAAAPDTAEALSIPTDEHIEVSITLPPLPNLEQLKAMTTVDATTKARKTTVTCQCP